MNYLIKEKCEKIAYHYCERAQKKNHDRGVRGADKSDMQARAGGRNRLRKSGGAAELYRRACRRDDHGGAALFTAQRGRAGKA